MDRHTGRSASRYWIAIVAVLAAACSSGTATDSEAADEVADAATTIAPPGSTADSDAVTTSAPATDPPEGDGSTDETSAATDVTTTIPAATTTTPVTTEPPPPEPVWTLRDAPAECMCSDGSPYSYSTRSGDPTKVLVFFQGGGACFSAEACDPSAGTYKPTTGPTDRPTDGDTGIWDVSNPANPFADWSVVFMPYCTGDVFRGDAEAVYSDSLTIQHRGAVNAEQAVRHVVDELPAAERIVVTGSSAGGVPTPWIGGLFADEFPDADVASLADGSGGYARNPDVGRAIGGIWGSHEALPDWPELDGLAAGEVSIPDMFKYAGLHAPGLRLARFDHAWDAQQAQSAAIAGLPGGMREVLDANEALAEDAGVRLDVYVASGTDHTILTTREMYTLETAGVRFIDWLTTFVEGSPPGDVTCEGDCGAPPPDG